MAGSLVSSIILFLLFIILLLFVDGNVFAARMEHRKLGGEKEKMTIRRNLEGGQQGSKIGAHGSTSHPDGGKTANVPEQRKPNQATAQRHSLRYSDIKRNPTLGYPTIHPKCTMYTRCKRGN
ncbi:uncharacterized protein LOC17900049 [Capsella rubella]|nr:uncharacterized protein LOC17900049 [Capsella rubella]